jgi:phenylalanyl-tRNA synthetase beta chain
MKASYRWLRTLVPQLTDSPEALATKLTFAGIEVEEIIKFGQGAAACVVVQVVSIRPHPSKSGLRLVTVDIGEKTQEIVCGAPNVPDAGGLVVLAPLGAYLPAKDLTIARRDIGGIESEGMLCSESELGLTDESDGILVLPAGTAAKGAPLIAAVPETEDTIFELGITPNRPDALGHIGLAREIAALYKFPWSPPTPRAPALAEMTVESLGISVRVDERERCPHFAAGAAVEVSVKPSPLWLRYRLSALGVRPISNVVDVTNLVMLEYGHPMHAFDLDKLERNDALIVVRVASAGEKLTTLDGAERTLNADDLVVCDGNKPASLAGVMGGKSSEVTEATKRVLLECAYFEPRGIRRAARRYGLHTDASHRFERGVDPSDIEQVLASASTWLSKLAGAKIASGTVHVQGAVRFPKPIRLRSSRIRTMLGVDLAWAESVATLEDLGCKVLRNTGATAEIEAPAHRPDITREIDLIEEVVRVKGLTAIPEVLPAVRPTRDVGEGEAFLEKMRNAATAFGLSEAIVLAMTSDESLAKAKALPATVRLKNPMSERGAVMRTSLLPGLLESASLARRHGEFDVQLFCVGSIFADAGKELPIESRKFAMLLAGNQDQYLARPRPVDLYDAKGIAEAILLRVLRSKMKIERDQTIAYLHPKGAARLLIDSVRETMVGHLGPVHPDVLEAFDLGEHAVYLEFDMASLQMHSGGFRQASKENRPSFRGLTNFPANIRDLAIIVKEAQQSEDVSTAILKAAGGLARKVHLFDRFTGGQIQAGHVSLAFRVYYGADDRTLTDAEVDAKHTLVVAEIQTRFGAEVRA